MMHGKVDDNYVSMVLFRSLASLCGHHEIRGIAVMFGISERQDFTGLGRDPVAGSGVGRAESDA